MFRTKPAELAWGLAACAILVFSTFVAGCAPTATDRPDVREPSVYPDWVRIVPASTEETTYHVGGCAMATDEAEGVELATADVAEQVTREARERFRTLFDATLLDARAQTNSMERLHFRTDGSEAYIAKLLTLLEQRDVYHRPCADDDEDGPVCSVFVLLTLEVAARDGALIDVLTELRKAVREEGSAGLADVAERMQRAVE